MNKKLCFFKINRSLGDLIYHPVTSGTKVIYVEMSNYILHTENWQLYDMGPLAHCTCVGCKAYMTNMLHKQTQGDTFCSELWGFISLR